MRLRSLAAVTLVAAAMFGTTAAVWPPATAATPQSPPALTAGALDARYAADARAIAAAERTAARDGAALIVDAEQRPGPGAQPLLAERPVVERDGALVMVDDERMPLREGERPMMKKVRFRTLGCYPLTGAIESNADTLPAIIQEMLLTRTSERQGRVIDHDAAASMERKKQEGYF